MKKGLALLVTIIMIMTFLVGCNTRGNVGKDVDLKEVHGKIKEYLGEDYLPSRELEMDEIKDLTGLTEDDIDTIIAEGPMMTMHTDYFIAIKAKEGKADIVEKGLEKYKTFMINDSFQYPFNQPKVNAAKVVKHGDYVFFLILGKTDNDMEDAESKDAKEFAESEVNKIVEIVDGFFK